MVKNKFNRGVASPLVMLIGVLGLVCLALTAAIADPSTTMTLDQLQQNVADSVGTIQKIISACSIIGGVFLCSVSLHYFQKHMKTRESGGTHILAGLTFFFLGVACFTIPQVSQIVTSAFLGTSNMKYEDTSGSAMNALIRGN